MSLRCITALTAVALLGTGALSSAGAQSTIVVAPSAPPPPRVETVPPPPTTTAYWEPGHWNWNGVSWVWMDGMYVTRPSTTAIWVPGQWILSPGGGYTWQAGHWQSG
jgi:hypothetical protein